MSVMHAALGVLLEGEQHGYRIGPLLAERVGSDCYNSGQIHMTLERLEERGWVRSTVRDDSARRRRTFTVTPAGKREFERWLYAPIPLTRPQRDAMVLRLPFLGERDLQRLIWILEERRQRYTEQLRSEEDAAPTAGLSRRAQLAMLADELSRFRQEAELRWIDHCLAQLGAIRQTAEPAPAAVLHEVPPSVGAGEPLLHASSSSGAA